MKLKTRLILGRKALTNLDSILKGRDITLPINVHLVKAMVFPVVMYGCENWTIKKAECQISCFLFSSSVKDAYLFSYFLFWSFYISMKNPDFPFTFHFHALEKEMATHSSVLAWRIPGTGEPGGLPSIRSHRVGHDWSKLAAAAAAAAINVLSLRSCFITEFTGIFDKA